MNEPTTNLNISGVPVCLLPEIDAISDIRSKAVVTLIREALDARKAQAARDKADQKKTLETGVSTEKTR